MKKITLALVCLFGGLLASFTVNYNNITSTVLNDFEGTLLKSAPIIENNNGDFTVTFSVDESVIVSSSLVGESNEIYLLENGNANVTKTVTLDLQKVGKKVETSFNNLYENNYDVAGANELLEEVSSLRRPGGVIVWE